MVNSLANAINFNILIDLIRKLCWRCKAKEEEIVHKFISIRCPRVLKRNTAIFQARKLHCRINLFVDSARFNGAPNRITDEGNFNGEI